MTNLVTSLIPLQAASVGAPPPDGPVIPTPPQAPPPTVYYQSPAGGMNYFNNPYSTSNLSSLMGSLSASNATPAQASPSLYGSSLGQIPQQSYGFGGGFGGGDPYGTASGGLGGLFPNTISATPSYSGFGFPSNDPYGTSFGGFNSPPAPGGGLANAPILGSYSGSGLGLGGPANPYATPSGFGGPSPSLGTGFGFGQPELPQQGIDKPPTATNTNAGDGKPLTQIEPATSKPAPVEVAIDKPPTEFNTNAGDGKLLTQIEPGSSKPAPDQGLSVPPMPAPVAPSIFSNPALAPYA